MELKRTEAGFSVVEVLIASLIFLIIAVGILPLFAASARNNLDGREATEVSNIGRSIEEELIQLPFNDPRLTVPVGSTERATDEYYSKAERVWKPGTGGGTDALWRRRIRVQQFGISAPNTPLDGGADIGQVHYKRILATVRHARDGNAIALGGGRRFSVSMLKSF